MIFDFVFSFATFEKSQTSKSKILTTWRESSQNHAVQVMMLELILVHFYASQQNSLLIKVGNYCFGGS